EKSRTVWDIVQNKGIKLGMLNIGGGFPIEYTDSTPSIDRISSIIKKTLENELPDNIDVFVEPGRALVGDSGIMVSTVIAKARRNTENWLYIDVGVFNGFMESIGGIQYSIVTEKEGPLQNWVLAGPSCDSMDVISNEIKLPDLEIGDVVYILSSGAYTTAYASRFNGF
ncbi:MAG: type III PLP-dependent enzyme, partial [candidate division Zixibacteria bacterium]|nr:type III PLP-dependent enzyme [candidate division Zixibacteria bacterium]